MNPTRKSKVWNEPVYNKRETIPPNLQPSQLSENRKEPFNLHVKVSSKLFNDPMRMYPMHYSVKGYALIINNQEFDDPDVYPYRKGAEVDGANMKRLFIQLGFNVMSYTNMTRNATLKKLIEFSEIAGSNESEMMVVCMLSHGMESDKIISADGFEIDIETDVLRRFNNDYCPELKGKPKFFIFQTCRHQELNCCVGGSTKGDVTEAVPFRIPQKKSINLKDYDYEDMLIAYSSMPRQVSYIDNHRGSWFIESLCKVFMEHAKDMDLRGMLDDVGHEQNKIGKIQSFSYEVRHFYKKLYFNPGINIDQPPN